MLTSRGIGAAIARPFVAASADVAFSYSASKEKADEALADIKRCKRTRNKADHAVQSEVVALLNTVVNKFGRIDILVNNASILAGGDRITPEPSTDETIATDTEMTVHSMGTATRVAALHSPSGGPIINIGSIVVTGFLIAAAI